MTKKQDKEHQEKLHEDVQGVREQPREERGAPPCNHLCPLRNLPLVTLLHLQNAAPERLPVGLERGTLEICIQLFHRLDLPIS